MKQLDGNSCRYLRRQLLLFGLSLTSWHCSGGKYLKSSDVEAPPKSDEFKLPEQVTAGNESNFTPDLSPNGAYVVYTSDRKGNKDIWEKRASGGYARALTLHAADDFSPVLSPNGKKIAFVSRREDAAGDIHILTSGFSLGAWWRGSKEGLVESISQRQTEDSSPAWFPDGERIVFAARVPGEELPAIMTASLENLKAESLGDAHGDQPTVSPDGRLVAYVKAGAIFLYDFGSADKTSTEKIVQLTNGGVVQDGQPRFTQDGNRLLFIRYADDSNRDGKLNGDDYPTIWSVDIAAQRLAKIKDNYNAVPLTAARFAAFSPQIRPPFLYFTLQQEDSLEIFKLPQDGQITAATSLKELQRQIDSRDLVEEKIFVIRRAIAGFAALKDFENVAEAALIELEILVQQGRRVEAELASARLRAQISNQAYVALSNIDLLQLDLAPLAYPEYQRDLTSQDQTRLTSLMTKTQQVTAKLATSNSLSRRVQGRALLLQAKILAAQRDFFKAAEILRKIAIDFEDDRRLTAEAAYYQALISPATSDVDTAVRDLKQVIEAYSDNQSIVLRASLASTQLLAMQPNSIERLAALRSDAKALPMMPAIAHRYIADYYAQQSKEAVEANELRQMVDSYPESPAIILEAAARLAKIEEKNGRQVQFEALLIKLKETLSRAAPQYQRQARGLLMDFYVRRGEALLREGEPGMAIKEYKKVIALEPLNISAHRGVIDATYKRNRDDLEGLLKSLEDVASQESAGAAEIYFWGYALTYRVDQETATSSRLAAIDRAIEVIEQARQLDSQILQIHQTLGWLYLQKGYWRSKYFAQGGTLGTLSSKTGMVKSFFGYGDPNWLELGIDSFLTAYYLSREDSVERAGLSQNLGQTYYELKNYQKSLSYYMQRIKLLPQMPERDPKVEGVIWRRAGRAAFNVEELDLAIGLQRQALKIWESLNDDNEVAYSLDALALTLRERQNYQEAADLYERLLTINKRLKNSENTVAALSNLGYCAFMNGRYNDALSYFDQAETELGLNHAALATTKETKDAIKVDLGGQSSAAKGFDSFARQNLIMSFRSQIYERGGRFDLAIQASEAQLQLLTSRREKVIDDGKPKSSLAEEIALVQNRLGDLRLAQGDQLRAKTAFWNAAAIAKELRPEKQAYMSRAEWVNAINYGRLQLRLATLGLVNEEELDTTVKDLENAALALKPVYEEGSKAEAKPLAQILSLTAALKAVGKNSSKTSHKDNVVNLEESLSIGEKVKLPVRLRQATLLTLASSQHATGAASHDPQKDKIIAELLKDFQDQSQKDPDLEWRYLAASGAANVYKAFEALDRFILGGGTLATPSDRLLARQTFEAMLRNHEDFIRRDAKKISNLVRRYHLLRQTDLARRAFGHWDEASKSLKISKSLEAVLSMRDDEDLSEVLTKYRQKSSLLFLYRFLTGDTIAVLQGVDNAQLSTAKIETSELLIPAAYSKLLKSLNWSDVGVGALYVIPNGELYDVPWEEVIVEGKTLAQKVPLAFVGGADQLPGLFARRTLSKNRLGYNSRGDDSKYLDNVASKGLTDSEALIPVDGKSIGSLFKNYDLIHSDAPLRLNDIEPKQSVIEAGAQAGFVYDLNLTQLADLELPSTQLLTFGTVYRDQKRLQNRAQVNDQGSDGWVLLSLAASSAQVPSILLGGENPGADPDKVRDDWLRYYDELTHRSAAEALQKTRINARLIGYSGIAGDAEIPFAKEKIEETLEEAEDAFADNDLEEAVRGFRVGYYFAQRLEDKDKQYAVLDRLVQVLFTQRDYQGALHYKQKMAALVAAKIKDKTAEPFDYAQIIMDAAVLAVRAQSPAVAEAMLAEAEKIFAEEDEKALLGKVYLYRGINLENSRKYQETIVAYQKSREFYLEVDPAQAASRLLDIGNVYRNSLSDYAQAIDFYDQAAAEFKKLGKLDLYLPVMIDKANTLMAIGQLELTIDELERRVIPQIDAEKSRNLWIRAVQILANAYYRAGLYQDAKDRNEQALLESAKLENKLTQVDRELDAINLRAMIKAKLGQYQEAFGDFKYAIAKAKEFKLKGQLSLLYNNFGFWLREFGQVDQSLEYFDMAMKIDQDLKSRSSIAYDLRNMGLSVVIKGDFNRAKELLGEALKISEELNLAYNTVYCHFGLGDMAMREDQWDKAQAAFSKALELSEKGYMQDFIWRAHAGLGAVAVAQKKSQLAEKSFRKAIQLVEKLRAGLKTEDSRNGFQSDRGVQELYRDEALVLMQLNKVEQAWTMAERGRARAYMDTIGSQKLKLAKASSEALLVDEKSYKSDLETIERRLSQLQDQTKKANIQAASLQSLHKEALRRYADHLVKMKTADDQLTSLVSIEAVSLRELKNLLPTETALIQYMVTPQQLLIWVIHDGEITGKTVDVAATTLRDRVRDFRLLMQNYSTTDYLGQELSDLLITPIKDELTTVKRLAIVPHDVLHFVPFAALPSLSAKQSLIDQFSLYYLDSATAVRFSASKRVGSRERRGEKILALASQASTLPFTQREVEVIGRYFPATVARHDSAASKTLLLSEGPHANVVHIATHGEFNAVSPADSRLQLENDEWLTVKDVFALPLKADLVTLSACDSGLGALSAGDEMIGLNKAFLYAGANSVVSNLWRVSDVANAVVMKRFYRYLSEGQDKDEALRQAQMVARRYFKHPAYWSSFRLAGDYQ